MKEIHTRSSELEMLKSIRLFNEILKKADYNLNKYVKGHSLVLPDSDTEDFENLLKEFANTIPDEVKNLENPEAFWELFSELDDYNDNDKFINWLHGYVESVIKPFIEAEYIRKLDKEHFEALTKYCFENLILRDIGNDKIDFSIGNENSILTMKKVLFTFIDMIIVNNYSKENAIERMQKIFGIKEDYCVIWWDIVNKYEDKLWRIMMMKKYDDIENKLEYIVNIMEESMALQLALTYSYLYGDNTAVKALVYGEYNHDTNCSYIFDVSALFYINNIMGRLSYAKPKDPLAFIRPLLNHGEDGDKDE